MARVKAGTWFNLVAGLIVGATAQPLYVGAAPDPTPPQAADGVGPSRAGAAMTAAAEALRRGDYDTAAGLLGQADNLKAGCAPAQLAELTRLHDALSVAVQARRAGAEQVLMAEQAVQQGNEARAADLLHRIAANEPFLTPEDRQRVAQLSQKVRAQAPSAADRAPVVTASSPGGALATTQARAKLQQARAQMAQFNFDKVEQLAHEAERLQPKLNPGEDSPKKVLDDLARLRTDPKALLTAARVALGRKDYDHAEQFAKMSEKNSGPFTFPFWADNPSRVLKDVQDLRARAAVAAALPKAQGGVQAVKSPPATKPAATPAITPVAATANAKPAAPAGPAPGSPEATVQAVALIKQARQALAANDIAKAKKFNDQARALKPDLHWWEDNPEKVRGDIARAEQKSGTTVTRTSLPAAAPTPATAAAARNQPQSKEEAVALVKKGRVLLAENKLDEAAKECLKARAMASLSWGLFEDTPEKLRQDIEKARVKRDREESFKVLADARRLYEEGKYDEASRSAYRAQKLHGAYSIWDLGDRPERVLADIQTAKIRIAKGQPVEVVKKNTSQKPAEAVAQAPKSAPAAAEDPAKTAQARQMLAEARVALRVGDNDRAKKLAEQVQSMHVVLSAPGDDSPESVLKDVQRLSAPRPGVAVAAQVAVPANDNKARAAQLLAEARELQKAQKLLEARAKVLEARELRVAYAPGEETPDGVLLNLSAEARWQVEWLIREAVKLTGTSGPDMAQRYQKAEQALAQARTVAAGFGMDVQPIDGQMGWIHGQLAAARGEAQPVPAAPAAPAAPQNQGQDMLAKARLELQSGETESARRLAEQVAQGPYGLQAEALAILRTVGAEEYNQRRLQSSRTFDAALAAYNRRDFRTASVLVQSVDPNNLDESRRNRLREMVMTAEMGGGKPPVVQVQATGDPGLPAVPALPGAAPAAPQLGEQPGFARAEDHSRDSLISQTQAMQQVKFQKLRQDGLEVQRDASEKFRTGQTDAAIEMLQDYLAQLNDAQLELGQVALLRRPVEARLQNFKLLKAQRDFLSEEKLSITHVHESKTQELLVEQNKQKKVAELMKQYNTLFKEGKYAESERLAMQAHELDPDNPMAAAAVNIARREYRLNYIKDQTQRKDGVAWESLTGTDEFGPVGVDSNGIVVNQAAALHARERSKLYGQGLTVGTKSETVRQIEHKLTTPVTLNFTDTPLKNVIDDLRAWQGINIFVDESALLEEGISLEKPVTIKLELVPMKSALNMLLSSSHLTWTIKDEVLQITTPKHSKGALSTKTFQVADLVIPIPDFGAFRPPSVDPPLPGINITPKPGGPTAATPVVAAPRSLTEGAPAGSASVSTFGMDATPSPSQPSRTGPPNTTEEKLMSLIKSTVAPGTWSDTGGPGTIDYFPLTLSLVINQTPDIQEQVADLLTALRRLQDQEVAIEVRFITIDDSFFERIGVNFNLNIQTKDTRVQPQLTSGVFTPDGYVNAFAPKNTIIGLQPTGTFTPDLNIPVTNQSYTQAFPDFGGYLPGGFGGLTMGLAFLSDIQVFLFLEAVQGDVRTNLMQAPKLTLFNGQTSTITVADFQTYVMGVQVIPQMGIFTFNPQQTVFPIGTMLTIQAVITADRRFVRMSLTPMLSNLAVNNVLLFPVTVPIFPQFDNSGTGQPVVFTQYLQLPMVNMVSIMTTVAVPDGGTVLMGGLKLLSEERKEYGPPILSKIPYLNRLFKNTSYGRDAQSILIMVTPRIIIQEEEEFKATGVEGRPPVPPF